MTPSRYYNAFLLTTLIFIFFYFIYLALPKTNKIVKPTSSSVIKVALINPVKKITKAKKVEAKKPTAITPPVLVKKIIPKPKKIVKKTVEKKIIKKKKVVKKKISKPKKIVKKKKIIKKKIVKKRVTKKKIVKKKIVKKKIIKKRVEKKVEAYIPIAQPIYKEVPIYKAPTPKPVIKKRLPVQQTATVETPNIAPTPVSSEPIVKSDKHKKAFLRNVRSKILANKKYPKIAKRRHIEGSVKVRFDITTSGNVTNIRFINGKSVFQKSIRKTLERSFPMPVPANVKSDLPIFDVSVVLHFNFH